MTRESKGSEKRPAASPPQARSLSASRPFTAAEGRVGPESTDDRSVKPREDERSLEALQLFAEEEEEEELP